VSLDQLANRDADYVVLAFAPYFLPGVKGGGPIRALSEILASLPESVSVHLVTSDRDLGDTEPYPGLESRVRPFGRHKIFYWNRTSLRSWWQVLRLSRASHYDVLFLNSFWSPQFTMFPWLLQQMRVIRSNTVLLAPRGELSPGALSLKRIKKGFALAAWGRLLSGTKLRWQVSNEVEESQVRRIFPTARTILQQDSCGPAPQDLVKSGATPRFVFISRISRMKNLRFLLEAVSSCDSPVTLDIYGPLEDIGYWNECLAIMGDLPRHIEAAYRGTLTMEQVQHRFSEYDTFLFPTLGENFGFVVPESLSAGCPVLSSPNTPWTSLLELGCGKVLPLSNTSAWTREIDRLARLPPHKHTENKRRALRTYSAWRQSQTMTSALELALWGSE
jgi:glycosyltransferase involved in cell wall biosynthesis